MKKIAIIGCGLTGLVASLRLSQKGFQVTLFDKRSVIGGLARTFTYRDVQIPVSPHQFFSKDRWVLQLLKELNVPVVWASSKTGIFDNHKKDCGICSLATPLDLLSCPLFSLKDKAHLASFGLKLKFQNSLLEQATASHLDAKTWLLNQTNQNIYTSLFEPLLQNKFAISPEEISAAWLAMLLRDSLQTSGKLGYFKNGIHEVLQRFEEVLKPKVSMKISTPILSIQSSPSRNFVLTVRDPGSSSSREEVFDAVLSTAAIPEFLSIAPSLPSDYLTKLHKVRYSHYVGAVLLGSQPFTKHHITYFLNSDIGALNDFSNFYHHLPYHILFIFKYVSDQSEFFKKHPDDIKTIFLQELKNSIGAIAYDHFVIYKECFATPVFDKDFPFYKPAFATPLPGLYLAGMFSAHPQIRNLDSSIKAGEDAAQIIASDLNPS